MSDVRLDTRVPEAGFASPDDALDAFLSWVSDAGFRLYPHQEEAILALWTGHHVVLDTPTGSGKSLVATALHFKTFAETGRTWYTAPIKALVSEKFFSACRTFGAEHVAMATGDGAINRHAPIVCATAEILANLALREGAGTAAKSVVMDEFHYYADPSRGWAWQAPLLTLPDTTFLLMSGTLGDTRAIREDLERRTGRPVTEVKGVHRPVPLHFVYSQSPLLERINDLVRHDRAPVYLVHFTQSSATEQAQALMSTDWCTKDEKRALIEATRDFRFTSPFGVTMRRFVLHGIGLHHAGLLPRYRLLVEKLAQKGLLKIICGTDTLGVGINVPIRSVLFTQLCKYDGETVDVLKVRDFRQIAGRAGRAGYDTEGFVVVQAPEHIIENLRAESKAGDDPKKRKKLVKAQPPQKGYKHWDVTTFQRLVEAPPERLESRFSVDHGRVLLMMQRAQERDGDAARGVDDLIALIDTSHSTHAEKDAMRRQVRVVLDALIEAAIVQPASDGTMTLDAELQADFSLHHSLSLFVPYALGFLDRDAPDHALRVVTRVEAILENPKAILFVQQGRARQALLAELKAQGVPFEDREPLLEAVTWPKPEAEDLYAIYNPWAHERPWVGGESLRPKSIVREMAESRASFAEYVKELGLQRMEGVLLRYLSEAYRAMIQNVPAEHRTESYLDVCGWLRATIGVADASLLTEWETLASGADGPTEVPKPIDISEDRRSFLARVRAELHALVRAFAREDWEEASAGLRRPPDGPWGPEDLEAALRPFVAEHGGVADDAHARLAAHTRVVSDGPHQWKIRQTLFPVRAEAEVWGDSLEEGEIDVGTWAIEARVDLRADTNPDGPIVEVVAIG